MRVEHINLEPADNGLILRYTYIKETPKKSESRYEDHKEIFTWEQEDKAMDRMKALHKMNIKRYKMKAAKNKASHNPGPKKEMASAY